MISVLKMILFAIFFMMAGIVIVIWGYKDHVIIADIGGVVLVGYGIAGIVLAKRIVTRDQSRRER